MEIVTKRLGISRSLTSVEHPETDGLVERFNRTIKTSLAAYTGRDGQWDNILPFVTFAYNTAKQSSTGFSPFEAMYRRKAMIPISRSLEVPVKTYEASQCLTYLNRHFPLLQQQSLNNLQHAQQRQKALYDRNIKTPIQYQPGDQVKRRVMDKQTFPKQRWTGPWTIISASNLERTAYHIKRLNHKNATQTTTCNVKHLRPWNTHLSEEGMM